MIKLNILICGKTGAGKTSLIQSITNNVVPDSAIGHNKPTTKGIHIYETDIANFIDCEGMEPGQTIEDYKSFIITEIRQRLGKGEIQNLIHCIWYCIDGSGSRVQDADIELIKTFENITKNNKVLLVITKSEIMRKEQIEAINSQLFNVKNKDLVLMVSHDKQTGLKKLLEKTQEIGKVSINIGEEEIKEFELQWKQYYNDKYYQWKQQANAEANEYINWAAGRAAAIAIIPIPLADVAPLMANEIYMIYRIGGVYGIAVDKSIITMLLGVSGASTGGKLIASFFPGVKIAIAAGITFGLGKAVKAYFESDMTLNAKELRNRFESGKMESKKTTWKPIDE